MVHETFVSGSYRDPDSYIDVVHGVVLRKLSDSYLASYKHYIDSGLHKELIVQNLVIDHEQIATNTLRPVQLAMISYPYEWCFTALKQAALTTLRVQLIALNFGMTLKDASAYNIQWHKGQMVHIDTGSFEMYINDSPWKAFGQFLKHFLYPLLLMQRDLQLGKLQQVFIDGIPTQLTSKLISKLNFSHMQYVHLPASLEHATSIIDEPRLARKVLCDMLLRLGKYIEGLKAPTYSDLWSDYDLTAERTRKSEIMNQLLCKLPKGTLWDLGCNDGLYSNIAYYKDFRNIIAMDSSCATIEKCYQKYGRNFLPLVVDLVNPSPAIGWSNIERDSLLSRGPADVVLALALIHHLVIGNNCTPGMVSNFFKGICKDYLVIEIITPYDVQVREMFKTRPDMKERYNIDNITHTLDSYFEVVESLPVSPTRYIQLRRRHVCI